MSEKKNLALIGYGGMGRWHGIMARQNDVVNLLGTYDPDPVRVAIAKEEDGVFVYDSLEALLADPRVDIVTVAVPNDLHMELCVKAMKAGKNVICEKPVAMNCEELEVMIATAKETGKVFSVHQNRRWDTDKITVGELIASGSIGKPLTVESRVHGSRGIPGDWRKEKAHGGGMIFDWAVHLIDQAIMIFEGVKVTSVYARVDNITTTEVDDGCHIVIGFENGVFYTVEIGTCNYYTLPRFYVRGTKGTALIRDWDAPLEVTIETNGIEKDAMPIKAQSGVTKTMAPRDGDTTRTFEIAMPESDVHDFYRNFCAAIDGTEEQLVKHDENRRVMKIIEASFESAEKNQVIHRVI
jgi:predicted dehydrogenase